MNLITMILFGLIQSLLSGLTNGRITNGFNLRSFSCLGMNSTTQEKCKVLGVVAVLPDSLLMLYKNQIVKVQNALDSGNLASLKEHELASLDPILLLLIPENELVQVGGRNLAMLLNYWSQEKEIARHLISAASSGLVQNEFIQEVRKMILDNDILDMIGEELPLDIDSMLGPLLIHQPIQKVLNLTTEQKQKMLVSFKLYANLDEYHWSSKKPYIQRIWSKLLIEENYPTPLNLWKDADVQTAGPILVGAKPSELSLIQGKNVLDKKQFFLSNYSSLQIRTLFESLYQKIDFSTIEFQSVKNILTKLLPTQLQRFVNVTTNFRSLTDVPHPKAIATSKQILQFLLRESKHQVPQNLNGQKDSILYSQGLLYTMPISAFQAYKNNPLDFKQLIPLQSKQLSATQVYYLTGAGININATSKSFYNMKTFLYAMPTSYLKKSLDSYIIPHLALNLPFENLPRLITFLQYASSALGRIEIFLDILREPMRLQIYDYLPHRVLQKELKLLLETLKTVPKKYYPALSSIPNKLAPFFLRNMNKSSFNLLKQSVYLKDNLLIGLTCYDISNLPTSDFIVTIYKYRRTLKSINKEFPKELQSCSARKLVEYLKLKSLLRQQFMDDFLITLLSPVEIEAVGGWVLIDLPLEDITASAHLTSIIRQIGSMSATEIIAAAPLQKIRKIIYSYLAFQETKMEVNAQDLFNLGNLTMVLTNDIINKIDYKAFKILLEGGFFDNRICATLSERNSWLELIQKAFGIIKHWTGEEIKILGNLIIVLPRSALNDISQEAWAHVADVVELGYLDKVQCYKNDTFIKVCQSFLPLNEYESYFTSIQTVAEFYLKAAQFQLNTVKRFEELWPSKELNVENLDKIYNSDEEDYKNNQLEEILINKHQISPSLDHTILNVNSLILDTGVNNSSTNKIHNHNIINLVEEEKLNRSKNLDLDNSLENNRTLNSKDNDIEHQNIDRETMKDGHNVQSDQEDGAITENIESESISGENPFEFQPTETPIANAILSNLTYLEESNVEPPNNSNDNKNQDELKPKDFITLKDENISSTSSPTTQSYIEFNAIKDDEVAPDLFSALQAIHQINPSADEYKQNLHNKDDLLQPLDQRMKQSESARGVIQPVNVFDLITLTPPKVKLLDVLHSSELTIYENITHALQAISDDETNIDDSEKYVPISDDPLLEPAMSSDEWDRKIMNKRSIEHPQSKVSCDAIKMVGIGIQLIITEDTIKSMSAEELNDCSEIFSSTKLSETTLSVIWSHLEKIDFHLKGQLLAKAKTEDLLTYNFNISNPWVLETIYGFSRFNHNQKVMKYIVHKSFSDENKLRVEEVVALGKYICHLPNLRDALQPSVLLRSSVILGSSLTCEVHCLNILASIASEDEAFGLSIHWDLLDFTDLGIIVAGLSTGNWIELMKNNPNVLYGLQISAAECLSMEHIQAIPKDGFLKIPYFSQVAIKERLKYTNLEELKKAFFQTENINLKEQFNTSHSASKFVNNYIISVISILHIAFYQNFNFYLFS